MYVDPTDWRPPSLLHFAAFDTQALLGGFGALFAFAGVVAFAVALDVLLGGAVFSGDDGAAASAPPPRQVITARFVQRGRVFRPNEMPNRQVPRLSTAPPSGVNVSKAPRVHRERPDAGPPPPNATDDLLRRLGDRAQIFAEIAEERDREGDPDGLEEGTERIARAGDLYAGQLYRLFRRGWTVPATISEEQKQSLRTSVTIDLSEDLHITGFELVHSSGNALFDQSVLNRIQEVKDSNTTLPEPPPEVAARFVGQTFTLRFRGRDAR
ncbi:MAG: TonB C-terminal domain-containing protein [Deltaproteobacteria bacterium]|nr:TonB C-terminal domain-containing protein [Deltaproteobacteria bacterium]